jgi:uncharacterized protein (DUF1810 family)
MRSTALERFRLAQDGPSPNFATAVAELEAGAKRSHWIWYVLPQLEGLGLSLTSQTYALKGAEEAAQYLRDDVLRGRLLTVARAIANHLDGGLSLTQLMGQRIDALKAVSCFTLFARVAGDLAGSEESAPVRVDCAPLAEIAARILTRAEEQGFSRCTFTLQQLAGNDDAPSRFAASREPS